MQKLSMSARKMFACGAYPTSVPGPCCQLFVESDLLIYFCFFVRIICYFMLFIVCIWCLFSMSSIFPKTLEWSKYHVISDDKLCLLKGTSGTIGLRHVVS